MILSDKERIDAIICLWNSVKEEIEKRGIDRTALLTDTYTQWALTTPLTNIGEHVYKMSSEFKEEHSEIKWNVVSGLRHRLVHNYEGTNWTIIAEVIFSEMDIFIEQIKEI